jgi:hypothetical protein
VATTSDAIVFNILPTTKLTCSRYQPFTPLQPPSLYTSDTKDIQKPYFSWSKIVMSFFLGRFFKKVMFTRFCTMPYLHLCSSVPSTPSVVLYAALFSLVPSFCILPPALLFISTIGPIRGSWPASFCLFCVPQAEHVRDYSFAAATLLCYCQTVTTMTIHCPSCLHLKVAELSCGCANTRA